MPLVTRTTYTTRHVRRSTTTVPVWLVKLVTCVLCFMILFFIYLLENALIHLYYKTFMLICLTVGALLGWSIGSVLQQVLTMRNVEISINFVLTFLSIFAGILCIIFLLDKDVTYKNQNFKMVFGMMVCFVFQSFVCILMLAWACYGDIVVFSN